MFDHPLRLPSPAKLNLFLHITGRRQDGFHDLQTVFQLLDYGDEVVLSAREDGRIVLHTPIPGLSDAQHLAVRAAVALQSQTGCRWGCEIAVHKRIPAGGGLGGGSSNAATTLLGLNYLWGCALDTISLQQLGRSLGADVPVFVAGSSAFAEGIGDVLTPLSLGGEHYLVLCPPHHVSTAEIFANKNLTRTAKVITIADFPSADCCNAFEAIVVDLVPEVGHALDALKACEGCEYAAMTGTGSSVFGRFSDRASRDAASDRLSHWRHFVAQGIDQSPLERLNGPSPSW